MSFAWQLFSHLIKLVRIRKRNGNKPCELKKKGHSNLHSDIKWHQQVPMRSLVQADHLYHDDVIKWKHFPRYWPFVRGIHRWPVNSPHKWPVTRKIRPVTQRFDVFFDLCLNEQLSKQSWGWWLETPSRSLWRQCNDIVLWGRLIRPGIVLHITRVYGHTNCWFSLLARCQITNLHTG